ncbi:MAG: hypothetical protein U0103_19545 [Candidatus Obscuribacterales bacterium]
MISQNTSTVPMQSEQQSRTTMRQHTVFIAPLIGITLLFFSPVLLHAHWGLFDDPSLILQSSRRLMDDPSTLSYILAAQMRMGIFYWVTVLWRLFPENPTGFFATNFLLISGALTMLYGICYKLTGNAKVSALSTATVLASPSLFEVIYTLDKQEVYFPFLFSAVVLLHLVASKCKPVLLPLFAVLSALCATAAYLSKETSIILALFSGVLLFANVIFARGNKREALARHTLMFVATIAPLLVLKFMVFPTINDKYVVMTFDIHKLLAKAWQYAVVVPDFFAMLTFTTGSGIYLAFSKKFYKSTESWSGFVALLAAALASAVALISFDTFAGVLMYIWLPIYFFLAPCLAFSVVNLPNTLTAGKQITRGFIAGLVLLLLSQIPTRVLQAQYQFSFDAMTAELARKLSIIASDSKEPIICAMPTYSVGETEIPEQIETHVRSILQKRYYETKSEKTFGQKFTMLNFLSPDCSNVHEAGDPPNTYKLAEFRGHSLSYTNECPPEYVGWTGFQILNGATPFQQWVKRPFGKNDLLIVPYGEVTPDAIQYRGTGIFAHPWKLKLLNFPQLKLEDVGHVERKLTNPIGHRQTMGWRILKVTEAEPVTFETSTDGWLKNDGKIFYHRDAAKPVLKITSNQPAPQAVTIEPSPSGKAETIVRSKDKDSTVIEIPLTERQERGVLKLHTIGEGSKLHIDAATYEGTAHPIETPFLPLTADGWLVNGSWIVYAPKDANKVLTITTLQPYADTIVSGEKDSFQLTAKEGVAKIPLHDGVPINANLLRLQLHSGNPITSSSDHREMVLHCDKYSVE